MIKYHAGVHEWNLTKAQAGEALRVSHCAYVGMAIY